MRAGKLRDRFNYQEPVDGPLSLDGRKSRTWPTIATFPGSLSSISGRELNNVQQQEAQATLMIAIRYPGFDIKPKGRLVTGQRIFNVTWIDNDENRNREVRVYVIESYQES